MRLGSPEARSTETAAGRRLLTIALDFPPAVTSGSARLISFARHLPEHHWETSVVTIRRSYHDGGETEVESSLPPGCQVVRAFGFDTKAVFSWRGRYPGVLAFPDRAASWIADGARRALRVCRNRQIDAILSSSPAVSAHLIAFVVKKVTGLPWVADLRDPWGLVIPHGPFLRSYNRKLEHRMMTAADRITVTTPGMADDLRQRCGDGVGSKLRLVTNGYDQDALSEVLEAAERPTRFRIIHLGSCWLPYRDPLPFLRALRLCLDRRDISAETTVELIGVQADSALLAEVTRLGLDAHVVIGARVSHHQALTAITRAAVLLVLQTRPDHDLCVPAKVYEYLPTDRAILAVVRDGSETARLLRGFDGVTLAPPTDVEAIATSLKDLHHAWAAGAGDGYNRKVTRYSRRHLAGEMATILDELCRDAA